MRSNREHCRREKPDSSVVLNGRGECRDVEIHLTLLDEILSHGNSSNLRLSKFKASLEPTRYLPDGDYLSETDEDGIRWLTIRGIVGDIWLSYKFEPFREKIGLLFKACEFVPAQPQIELVRKHVQLRNCVQHHERRLTSEALQQVGVEGFEILMDDGSYMTLSKGAEVRFTFAELDRVARAMSELADTFYQHTVKRIRRKVWVPKAVSGTGTRRRREHDVS